MVFVLIHNPFQGSGHGRHAAPSTLSPISQRRTATLRLSGCPFLAKRSASNREIYNRTQPSFGLAHTSYGAITTHFGVDLTNFLHQQDIDCSSGMSASDPNRTYS